MDTKDKVRCSYFISESIAKGRHVREKHSGHQITVKISIHVSRYVTVLIKIQKVTVHEKNRYKSEIAILDNAHLKVQTLYYFMLKSDWPNGDKITFEIMQFCFLHSIPFFIYTYQFC